MGSKIIFSLFTVFFAFFIKAQNEFITLWKPSNPALNINGSTSNSNQINFPGQGTNYTITWEEVGYPAHNGTLSNVTSTLGTPVLINFGTPSNPTATNATYLVKVSAGSGSFSQVRFWNWTTVDAPYGDIHKILEVKQWGNIAWASFFQAFLSCSNLNVTATDSPNLSGVTDMSYMFGNCPSLIGNSSMNIWNTSAVTNMKYMFWSFSANQSNFNQSLSNWNTAAVTDMSYMFKNARFFNQNIGNWDTGNVTSMEQMFYGATAFNQNLNWNTGKVTSMKSMFYNCINFNGNVSNWNTALVTTMNSMFNQANVFNQNIGGWNTGNVTDMTYMLKDTLEFNQPIGNWNTSKVTNMYGLFLNAQVFNQNINNWNTGLVTDMRYMFYNCYGYNQPMDKWNTGSVTSFSGMFSNALAFNQPIGNWNTAAALDMANMFNHATAFNQPLSSWNTANVINMSGMFNAASAFNQPIGNWNTSKNTSMFKMFSGDLSGATVSMAFNQPIGNWDTSKVTSMYQTFYKNPVFDQNLGNWSLASVTNIQDMLKSSGLTCGSYNATLIGWANNASTPSNRYLGDASPLKYSTPAAQTARNTLVATKGWQITGDVYDTSCIVLGAVENNVKENTKIYPNPAKDFVNIFVKEKNTIVIYDASGRKILEKVIHPGENQVDISMLKSGVYFLKSVNNHEKLIVR